MQHAKELCKTIIYFVSTYILLVVMKILFHLRINGREKVEKGKEYIIVTRHRSYWDIPLLAVALGGRRKIHFISQKKLLKNPFFYLFLKAYSTIIDRDNFKRDDFRKIIAALNRNKLIGIFPEGTTRVKKESKTGVIHFAEMSGKEILPVNIQAKGSYPPRYPFRLPSISISIGHPFAVAELKREDSLSLCQEKMATQERRYYQRLSKLVMERIDSA
ncbi:1-acyl-sn-glycerol-3-phosphate acyltransferase [Candidatus Acetothermia bacterium]|nr:1-acyl-sn-glycerol-3-phosphate acyltransferase [Candidatus Acetothermia bacterium]